MEEIIEKTKLDEECIKETINRRKNYQKIKTTETKKPISLQNDVKEMKNEIKELKNTIKELVEMMKAVYEFEDVT